MQTLLFQPTLSFLGSPLIFSHSVEVFVRQSVLQFVNGNVFVDMKEQVDCDAIVVQCKGKEKVYWQETRTR